MTRANEKGKRGSEREGKRERKREKMSAKAV